MNSVQEPARKAESKVQAGKSATKPVPAAGTPRRSVVTRSVCLWPHFGCAKACAEMLAPQTGKLDWNAVNDSQTAFSAGLSKALDEMARKGFSPEELRYRVTKTAAEMNQWFAQEGFQLTLSEQLPPAFYAGSILKVFVRWLEAGTQTEISPQGKRYPAAHVKSGVRIMQAAGHDCPIAYLQTRTGDQVYMTAHADPPADEFAFSSLAQRLSDRARDVSGFKGVIFPFVEYDEMVDVSWLQGFNTTDEVGRPWVVAEAKQQTKFKMNHKGARVESAAGWGMRCTGVSQELPPLVIDRPFMLWIVRDELSLPIFSGYFNTDAWKDPGEIDLGPEDT